MEPIKIILNPISGRGYGAKVEPELRRLLEAEGSNSIWCVSTTRALPCW